MPSPAINRSKVISPDPCTVQRSDARFKRSQRSSWWELGWWSCLCSTVLGARLVGDSRWPWQNVKSGVAGGRIVRGRSSRNQLTINCAPQSSNAEHFGLPSADCVLDLVCLTSYDTVLAVGGGPESRKGSQGWLQGCCSGFVHGCLAVCTSAFSTCGMHCIARLPSASFWQKKDTEHHSTCKSILLSTVGGQ